MKRVLFILCSIPLLLFSPVSFANAQETSDFSKLNPEDYTNISLPPLDLLFENAKGGPIYELASVKEQIGKQIEEYLFKLISIHPAIYRLDGRSQLIVYVLFFSYQFEATHHLLQKWNQIGLFNQ